MIDLKGKIRNGISIPKHKDDGFPDVFHTHLGYDGTGFVKDVRLMPTFFDSFDNFWLVFSNCTFLLFD